ncbi:hypothetical protein [Nostoc piscinale]|uniref:hypothetical protein n=1 Tax=Nostoc piscinale TaxID=224012 RepID=UPI000A9743A4|nr:hypothetical protein [Nostoc piscinale]
MELELPEIQASEFFSILLVLECDRSLYNMLSTSTVAFTATPYLELNVRVNFSKSLVIYGI